LERTTRFAYGYVEGDPLDASDPSGPFCIGSVCTGFDPRAGLDAIVNIGRGASFGLTDKIANWISPGASCTVAQNGIDQAIGGAATTVVFGELRAIRAAEGALTTPRVGSAKLQNIDDLYKGTTNPGRVGTGTTADAIRYELRTGEQVFDRSDIQKSEDYVRGIENWLKRNPDADFYDRLVGRSVADDLLDALGRSG